VPWGNPTGAILGPLALLGLIYGRKRKKNGFDYFVIILFVALGVGMGLSACVPAPAPSGTPQPPSVPPSGNSTPVPPPSNPTTTPPPPVQPSGTATSTLDQIFPYPCPTPTWTPTPATGDLASDDIKILSLFIAAESSSGWVPDDVSYKKAWALLNKHSYDLLIHTDRRWTPFESWKHHERGVISGTFGITDPTIEGQKRELLGWYAKALSGGWTYMKPARFSQIEMVVRSAVTSWALNGSRSPADPVHGAIDFTDAEGLCFSDMGRGNKCKGSGTSDDPYVYFGQMGTTYENVRRDPVTLEEWRQKFWPNDSTYVYQIGIDPNHNNDPIFTFTRFKQPIVEPWPPLP
jgi:hypothetical protein